MTRRTKGEQRAYFDGYQMCAECLEEYLTDKGKKVLMCMLSAVKNAVDIEDENSDAFETIKGYVRSLKETGMGKEKSLEHIEKFIDAMRKEQT